jgi:hypothetical protein
MNEINDLEDHLEDMSEDAKTEDYEVGYGKPPKSGRFKKGVSGNASGRPRSQQTPTRSGGGNSAQRCPLLRMGSEN